MFQELMKIEKGERPPHKAIKRTIRFWWIAFSLSEMITEHIFIDTIKTPWIIVSFQL